MNKKVGIIKRVLCLSLIFLLNINVFAAVVSDNDGSAFITKAEFDSLKNNFNSQVQNYNDSIDRKIDGSIAQYLAGIQLASERSLDNLYERMENKVTGSAIFWSSATTCIYNKAEFTNIGIKLDVYDMKRRTITSGSRFAGFGNFSYVWDWPIKNIITDGGFYKETNDRCTIDMVGDEFTWNYYNTPYSGYAGYYPTSDGWGRYLTIGKFVKSIGTGLKLVTNYYTSMNFIYNVDVQVVRDDNSYFLLEPNCSESVYSFDEQPGYKTFNWPAIFTDGTFPNYTTLNRSWTELTYDASVDDKWKNIDGDAKMTNVLNDGVTISDFPYNSVNCRLHKWKRYDKIFPWDEVYHNPSSTNPYAINEYVSGTMSTSYQPGAVYLRNYGEHKAVNDIPLAVPHDEFGIFVTAKEGCPVLKMAADGDFLFSVMSDKPGLLVVQNIGSGDSSHTTTLITSCSLSSGTMNTITAPAYKDDVITVKFLPTSASDKAKLTVIDTKQTFE